MLNDPSEFFTPNFLALNIQEVFDVLDGSLQANKVVLEPCKLLTEVAKRAHAILHLRALCIHFILVEELLLLDLSFLDDWLIKDKLVV